MNDALFAKLWEQYESLIGQNRNLQPYFVPIYISPTFPNVPFLPIGTFRHFSIFQKERPDQTFRSSGSTQAIRAQHSFSKEGLQCYAKASAENFLHFLQSKNISVNTPIISLVPKTSQWPQSSLAAMIAMFQQQGLSINYADVETESLNALKETLVELRDEPELTVFGTSFHHLMVAQHAQREPLNKLIENRKITLIDTGGTKGHTQAFSLAEMQQIMQQVYASATNFQFLSEYGMCELASQAWSLHSSHDGWFQANKTLIPFIIDLDQRSVIQNENLSGFLSFIDEGNQDSYMAIITEDIASMQHGSSSIFKLEGRAPDASMKGCSLNVKTNFFSLTTTPVISKSSYSSNDENIRWPLKESVIENIVDNLPIDVWDRYSQEDLLLTLQSLTEPPNNQLTQTRRNQRICIVLPANIPISWIYPAVICMLRGAEEVHLQLPSIRSNDPLSERIRTQTSSLVKALAPIFNGMPVVLHEERSLSFDALQAFDAIVVFGTDTTAKTFRTAMGSSSEIIGLGDVQNAYIIKSSDRATEIANLFAQWLGRGCLTPIALIGADSYPDFSNELISEFDEIFSKRLQAANVSGQYFHRHAILEIEARLKTVGLNPNRLLKNKSSTWIVDLRSVAPEKLAASGINFSTGGSGLLFQITAEQFKQCRHSLQTFKVNPSLWDPHTSKTWDKWIP